MGGDSDGIQVGDTVRMKADSLGSDLFGREGKVVFGQNGTLCRRLLVEFVGWCGGHDGFTNYGKQDGAKNRWYLDATALTKVDTFAFKRGDRVRYIGCAGVVGTLGDVVCDQSSTMNVYVAWDTLGRCQTGVFPHNIEKVKSLWALAPFASDFDVCADVVGAKTVCYGHAPEPDTAPAKPAYQVGDFVIYEDDDYMKIVAIVGYEAWVRSPGGVSEVVDLEDLKPA